MLTGIIVQAEAAGPGQQALLHLPALTKEAMEALG
jgi:hypothetical protein